MSSPSEISNAQAALVRYDSMCRAIDLAFEVDEVKDIRDKAIALETYARQARNTEAERRACEIRLRAERKAGALLRDREKNKGAVIAAGPGRGKKAVPAGNRVSDKTPKLADIGVTKKQSSQWQTLAAVPEKDFETALAAPEKPSTAGIVAAAAPAKEPKHTPMDERALWLWGRLHDFERDGILDSDPDHLLGEMTDAMRADTLRILPLVTGWLVSMQAVPAEITPKVGNQKVKSAREVIPLKPPRFTERCVGEAPHMAARIIAGLRDEPDHTRATIWAAARRGYGFDRRGRAPACSEGFLGETFSKAMEIVIRTLGQEGFDTSRLSTS